MSFHYAPASNVNTLIVKIKLINQCRNGLILKVEQSHLHSLVSCFLYVIFMLTINKENLGFLDCIGLFDSHVHTH